MLIYNHPFISTFVLLLILFCLSTIIDSADYLKDLNNVKKRNKKKRNSTRIVIDSDGEEKDNTDIFVIL